ncbi:MAG: preprotein translocase subunit YajC [Verrucomicrobiota bacterium]
MLAQATQPNPKADMIRMIGTFVIFGLIFYFVMIRPQSKRAKQQAEMLKSVKAGDKILTTGGILAVVITVKDKSLSIRSADAKMEITKSAVTEIIERAGETSEA